ncbi:hypothetical protein, partial [Nguyenibacter vanlangensis]
MMRISMLRRRIAATLLAGSMLAGGELSARAAPVLQNDALTFGPAGSVAGSTLAPLAPAVGAH